MYPNPPRILVALTPAFAKSYFLCLVDRSNVPLGSSMHQWVRAKRPWSTRDSRIFYTSKPTNPPRILVALTPAFAKSYFLCLVDSKLQIVGLDVPLGSSMHQWVRAKRPWSTRDSRIFYTSKPTICRRSQRHITPVPIATCKFEPLLRAFSVSTPGERLIPCSVG
jgi:hypothetical protein